MLQRNPSAIHNLEVAHTTKWSRRKRLIGYKVRLDAKPYTRHNLNNLHLDSNSMSHTTWRYYVILIIHFTDEPCLEITPLPSYEAANFACTSYATPHLYSCIFQIWATKSPSRQCCHSQYHFCDVFSATRPTAGLETNLPSNSPWSYTPHTNTATIMVFHRSLVVICLSLSLIHIWRCRRRG